MAKLAAGGVQRRVTMLGIGAVVTLLVVAAALGIYLSLSGVVTGDVFQPVTVSSWRNAAAQTKMDLYEPAYLPAGSGSPAIKISRVGQLVEGVNVTYPGGLALAETRDRPPTNAEIERVTVPGAQLAYFETVEGERSLVVQKGNTAINLYGASDAELLKVATSLKPVREG